jgi:choline dehydrogenase
MFDIPTLLLAGLSFIGGSSAFPLRPDEHKFSNRAINSTSIFSSYDFIIVGGGTAGLVLANRLTETNSTVLVLEDGTRPDEVKSYQPPGANQQVLGKSPALTPFKLWVSSLRLDAPDFAGSAIDWGFTTSPQAGLDDRQITYNRKHTISYR